MIVRALSFLVGVAAFVALSPNRAAACSCTGITPQVLLPEDGSRVPRNARIWVHGPMGSEAMIISPAGEEIAYDVTEIALGLHEPSFVVLSVLTPVELLSPGENYSIRRGGGWPDVRFSVNDEMDSAAPDAPEVAAVKPEVNEDMGNSCGIYYGTSIWMASEGVVLAFHDTLDTLQQDPPSGRAFDVAGPAPRGPSFWYGTACGPEWPGDDTLTLRFAAYDVAGNLSPMTEPKSFQRPQPSEDGCSIGGPNAGRSSAFAPLVLALLALSRALQRHRARSAPVGQRAA